MENYRVLIDEIENGKVSLQTFKDIGLQMDPKVKGVCIATKMTMN